MTFASGLKRAMKEAEISQTELAIAIGKGKSSISQYLSGKNIPRGGIQEKIAEALNCTVEELNSEKLINQRSKPGNVSVEEAAKALGKSAQFIRLALQRGVVPFGFAVSLQYIYDLSKEGFISFVHNTTEGFAHNLPTYHYDITTKANGN